MCQPKSLFQMSAAMCQLFPAFIHNEKSQLISISCDFHEKHTLTHSFSVSIHNSYFSLENCKFHNLLIGSSFDLFLQRLGNFHFTYQIVDCL